MTKRKDNIDDIFEFKDEYYLKWSIDKIVNWEHSADYHEQNLTHIHGTKDIIFPIENIENAIQNIQAAMQRTEDYLREHQV